MESEREREKEREGGRGGGEILFLLGVSLGFTNHSIISNIATEQEFS